MVDRPRRGTSSSGAVPLPGQPVRELADAAGVVEADPHTATVPSVGRLWSRAPTATRHARSLSAGLLRQPRSRAAPRDRVDATYVGLLLAATDTSDIADAHVGARRTGIGVVTGDLDDRQSDPVRVSTAHRTGRRRSRRP
jgi:hypothetical protein